MLTGTYRVPSDQVASIWRFGLAKAAYNTVAKQSIHGCVPTTTTRAQVKPGYSSALELQEPTLLNLNLVPCNPVICCSDRLGSLGFSTPRLTAMRVAKAGFRRNFRAKG